jgi:hypothetical protein
VASTTQANRPLSRSPNALARAIGASAGPDVDSSPLAAVSWSSTVESSRCSTPTGAQTARARRRCIPVDITADACADSRSSAGLRSSDRAYAAVPNASPISSEWPLAEPSPCRTASGIWPTARPSTTRATMGKNPSATMNRPSMSSRTGLVSHSSRSTRSRGDRTSRPQDVLGVRRTARAHPSSPVP